MKMTSLIASTAIIFALGAVEASAQGKAKDIYTGGQTGAYHSLFCPPIPDALSNAYFKGYQCKTTGGTLDNIRQVLANPQSIGFAQLDVYAREAAAKPADFAKLTVVRQLACEGLWMVTKGSADDYGKVLGLSRRIQFVLPPETSGSAATFAYLRQIDPDGIGRASNVRHSQSVAEMLKQVASSRDDVGLFVQFADPTNDNIKAIEASGLKVVPVVSREIVAAKVGDQSVYQVQTFSMTAGGFISSGKQATTACTPVVIFTGKPDQFTDRNERDNQTDLIKAVRDLPDTALLPKEGRIASIIKGAKTLAGPAVADMLAAVDAARKTAEGMMKN